MSEELEARFRVSLVGKSELGDFLRDGQRDVRSFASTVRTAFGDAGKQIASFGYQTGKNLASMATGDIGIASSAKRVLELRDGISALVVASGKGAEMLEPLRQQIHAVAGASGQMQDAVLAALGTFVAKTGDLDTARNNLALYAKVATATGAALEDVANVGVELKQKLGIDDQAKAMAVLVQQAKLGAIEFKDMASVGPKILAAAASSGAHGDTGIANAGAAVQVIASGFGGRGQGASAATSYENMIAVLQKSKTRGAIENMGIPVAGRDANEVVMDIIRHTHGDPTAMAEIFRTRQSFRAAQAFALDYKNPEGEFAHYKQFQAASSDPEQLDKDFATRSSTGLATLNKAQVAVAKAIDDHLGPAFEGLAKHADALGKGFEFATDHLALTAAAVGVGMVGKNVVGGLLQNGIGGLVGKAIPGAGVPHVWVDNMGGGMTPQPSGAPTTPMSLMSLLGLSAGPLALGGVGIAYTEAHATIRDGMIDGIKNESRKRARDLASGKIHRTSHWYNFGGASDEIVTDPKMQAKYAAEYRENAAKAGVDIKSLNVYLDGDKASVQVDDGTRSPQVMVTRSAVAR